MKHCMPYISIERILDKDVYVYHFRIGGLDRCLTADSEDSLYSLIAWYTNDISCLDDTQIIEYKEVS